MQWTNKTSSNLNLNLYSKQVGGLGRNTKCVVKCKERCKPNCGTYCDAASDGKEEYEKYYKELLSEKKELQTALKNIKIKKRDDLNEELTMIRNKLKRGESLTREERSKLDKIVMRTEKLEDEKYRRDHKGGRKTRKRTKKNNRFKRKSRGGSFFKLFTKTNLKPCEESCNKTCDSNCEKLCDDAASSIFKDKRVYDLEDEIKELKDDIELFK